MFVDSVLGLLQIVRSSNLILAEARRLATHFLLLYEIVLAAPVEAV